MKQISLMMIVALLPVFSFAQERIDSVIIEDIKREAFSNSKVMDHAFYLSDVYGPRLTGSTGFDAAAAWAEKRLKEYGLVNIKREPFAWGRGWSATGFRAEMTIPQFAPLFGYTLPWSSSTRGLLKGEPVIAFFPDYATWSDSTLEKYFEKYTGKLKGKMVLADLPHSVNLPVFAPGKRFSTEELQGLIKPWPSDNRSDDTSPSNKKPFEYYADKLMQFYSREGVALLIFADWGRGGGVMQLSHAFGSTWLHVPKYPVPPPMIGLSLEQYNRIIRLLTKKIPVQIAVEVSTQIQSSIRTFNITAEIPGSDQRDEVVMIGAHLDSWAHGTGATDNAAGVSVMIEAIRIIQQLKLKPRRTIRIVLWGGHEGEGTGSKTYVAEHYGTASDPKNENTKISAYYNLDNGTGRIRGIYTNGNAQLLPVFTQWFKPFDTLGASAVSINTMTGTDHVAFEESGIPGFQFIQDPLDYEHVTHHTNLDVYDYLKEADLQQASAIITAFAYQTAVREALLPRKTVTFKAK